MAGKFSTSVNIIRDEAKEFDYIVTPNAEKIAKELSSDYEKGFRSFTLIGSYGTGKSSFLLAFDQALRGKGLLKSSLSKKYKKIETLRVVGHYQSLISYFTESFNINNDFEGNQKIFDHLFQLSEKSDLLVIYLDEFGKFLEYASKNNPYRELYFLQQLAEFANDHERNILLIATLHQNFEAYSGNVAEESQKKEWRKVKGRYKELTFNEPIEQLLFLAAEKLKGNNSKAQRSFLKLAKTHNILSFSVGTVKALDTSLAPLDIISATVLTKALQVYGQNERSLFTFLESDAKDAEWVDVQLVYHYLLSSFYTFLNTAFNPHYRQWQAIQTGIERVETQDDTTSQLEERLIKTIGMLQLFASKGAKIDAAFLCEYLKSDYTNKEVDDALIKLEKRSIVKYTRYNQSYKIIEGTDVDFDQVLHQAEESIDRPRAVASLLEEHFDFPVLQAKKISYKKGTPRLFGFKISDEPLSDFAWSGAIDGYVNLVFNESMTLKEFKSHSADQEGAILYGQFQNSKEIRDRLFEILKTKKVLADNQEDLVAKQEFKKILESHERLLSHEVAGALYSEKVRWFFAGREVKGITSQRQLNGMLSLIIDEVYPKTPVFNNELLNKHKISTSIHTARKNYFKHLSEHWSEERLGFDADKFPPEKTIYKSLLVDNGMHQAMKGGGYELTPPSDANGFHEVWEASLEFLKSTQEEPRSIFELWKILESAPFKLKLGLIDFWVPTFLFINRGDFALYENGKFIPYLNESVLYLLMRQPKNYQVKAFEISGLRLKVFNKYREFLDQSQKEKLNQDGFIESVRPFLVFYKNLDDYSKNTQRLSLEALQLRNAIVDAQDPERVFFEAIPQALKVDLREIENDPNTLVEFAARLNDAVDEIKRAYTRLLDRFEQFITDEILADKLDFNGYKDRLKKRYDGIEEHRLLPKQKVLIQRLQTPLDDRESWLGSIAQALLNKPLNRIKDEEEDLLKDQLRHALEELDNLVEISAEKKADDDQIARVAITTEQGMKVKNVRITAKEQKKVQQATEEIEKALGKNPKLRLAILSKLLEKEFES